MAADLTSAAGGRGQTGREGRARPAPAMDAPPPWLPCPPRHRSEILARRGRTGRGKRSSPCIGIGRAAAMASMPSPPSIRDICLLLPLPTEKAQSTLAGACRRPSTAIAEDLRLLRLKLPHRRQRSGLGVDAGRDDDPDERGIVHVGEEEGRRRWCLGPTIQ
jgi:hypothetical protein